MVKKDEPYLFSVIKDASGRIARAERNFRSPMVLDWYAKLVWFYLYT